MYYTVILASCMLCVVSVPMSFDSKNKLVSRSPLLLIRNSKEVSDDKKTVKHQYLHNTIDREKRSLWTRTVNHISAVAETFQMKPLLVEGINEVDSYGNTINNKLNNNYKFRNVMFSKGTGNGKKPATAEEEALEKSKQKIESMYEKKNTLREDLKRIIGLHNLAVNQEKDMLEVVQERCGLKPEDFKDMYELGTSYFERSRIYDNHIDEDEDLKKTVDKYLMDIRFVRNEIGSLNERFGEKDLSIMPKDEKDYVTNLLQYIFVSNGRWFEGAFRPDILEPPKI